MIGVVDACCQLSAVIANEVWIASERSQTTLVIEALIITGGDSSSLIVIHAFVEYELGYNYMLCSSLIM